MATQRKSQDNEPGRPADGNPLDSLLGAVQEFMVQITAQATKAAGAIAGGMFLNRFVPASVPWVHVDLTHVWEEKEQAFGAAGTTSPPGQSSAHMRRRLVRVFASRSNSGLLPP